LEEVEAAGWEQYAQLLQSNCTSIFPKTLYSGCIGDMGRLFTKFQPWYLINAT